MRLFLEADGRTGYWSILLHLSRRELFCKACSKSKWLLKLQEAMAKCFKSCHSKVYWLTFGIYFWILLFCFFPKHRKLLSIFDQKKPQQHRHQLIVLKKCFPGWTWGNSLIMTDYCCCCSSSSLMPSRQFWFPITAWPNPYNNDYPEIKWITSTADEYT